MKKFFAVVLLINICIFAFVGCSGKQKELDYKSMLNTETNAIISIGDDKTKVDKYFGDSTYDSGKDAYIYLGETMIVKYLSGKVTAIIILSNDIFEIEGYKIGMSEEEVGKTFTEDSNDYGSTSYIGYYDDRGIRCREELAAYTVGVSFKDGKCDGILLMLAD